MERRSFIVLSTGHVSEETAHLLDNTEVKKWPCVGGPYGIHGWFVYADDDQGDIPDDLFKVMTWARGKGIEYILFDCDADFAEELPHFDW